MIIIVGAWEGFLKNNPFYGNMVFLLKNVSNNFYQIRVKNSPMGSFLHGFNRIYLKW